MAINNGSLYVGNASNNIFVSSKSYAPYMNGKHKISINNASTFKVSSEASFFGAYSSNATVKAKAYNDLRFQFNKFGETINANLASNLFWWSYQDPQWSTINTTRQNLAVSGLGVTKSRIHQSTNFSNFSNTFKVNLQCTFDDVNLITKLSYPITIASLSYV
jgi:hypothetical protein